jgi:dCTP diphosphatase
MSDFEQIKNKLRVFASDRDWDQFHSPKNLAMALSVEVAELVEPFQWVSEEGSKNLAKDTLDEVADEIADIQLCLIRLADKLGIDIIRAVDIKIEKNEVKYPADKVRGSSKKYTEYEDGELKK